MASKVTSVVLLVFILCLSGEWMGTVNAIDNDCVDHSSFASCSIPEPPTNTRRCFEIDVDDVCDPESECTAISRLDRGKNIRFRGRPRQAKINSPGGTNYRNGHRCRYLVECPNPNMLLYYDLSPQNFRFEAEVEGYGCLDFLRIDDGIGSPFEVCGNGPRGGFSGQTAVSLSMEFRSNTIYNFPGFVMSAYCIQSSPNLRRKRQAEESECRQVPDTNPTRPRNIRQNIQWPPTGDHFDVPINSAFRYRRNVIRIDHARIRVTYPGIRRLIFNTRYNNETTIFERNAPQGVLFGGGVLYLYEDHAVYETNSIPPELVPNSEERRIISQLLDATTPFFLDNLQEGGDIDLPETENGTDIVPTPTQTTSTSTISTTTSTSSTNDQVLTHKYPYYPYYPYYYIDPRIDLQALEIAETFENACNDFLQGAAQSYLSILDELQIRPPPQIYYKEIRGAYSRF